MGVLGHLDSWGQRIGVLWGPETHLEQKKLAKVNSLASSVGFTLIVLKIAVDAGNEVQEGPFRGNQEFNCYSMFRTKLVNMVGNSSVGFGPIELKFGGNAENDVSYKGNPECNCFSMFRAKSSVQGGHVLCGYCPDQADTFRGGG